MSIARPKLQPIVDVKYGDKSLGTRRVQLVRGLNRVAFTASIKDASGPITLEAQVTTPNDTFLDNNKFRTSVVVQGRPKILYIEGRPTKRAIFDRSVERGGHFRRDHTGGNRSHFH